MTTSRIQQIYGYLVCLIAIVTILISSASLVDAVFNLSRPEGVSRYGGLTMDNDGYNYESFRLQRIERASIQQEKTNRTDLVPSDEAIRAEFDQRKAATEASERWQTKKDLGTSSLSLIIAILLFLIHWRWLKSIASKNNNA